MKVFLNSTYLDLIEHRKTAQALYPHGDESPCYIYKVRLSGLADLSRLRKTSRGFQSTADTDPREPTP